MPQGDNRIETHGPSRRQSGGDCGHEKEQQRGRDVNERLIRFYTKDDAAERARQQHGAYKTRDNAQYREA